MFFKKRKSSEEKAVEIGVRYEAEIYRVVAILNDEKRLESIVALKRQVSLEIDTERKGIEHKGHFAAAVVGMAGGITGGGVGAVRAGDIAKSLVMAKHTKEIWPIMEILQAIKSKLTKIEAMIVAQTVRQPPKPKTPSSGK